MPDGALQRAVELLGRLGEDSAEHTVAELATETGMPTSTAYRLLAELEQHGLVQRGADRTVALGTRLVALGRTAEAGLLERLVEPARELMSELSTEVGETVILTAPCGLEAIVLHAVETDRHSVRLSYARFRRAPMHLGASGKILAAYLEPAERERLLETGRQPGAGRAAGADPRATASRSRPESSTRVRRPSRRRSSTAAAASRPACRWPAPSTGSAPTHSGCERPWATRRSGSSARSSAERPGRCAGSAARGVAEFRARERRVTRFRDTHPESSKARAARDRRRPHDQTPRRRGSPARIGAPRRSGKHTDQGHELDVPRGLAALSLDALSSVAYGPEQVMLVLVLAGAGALHYTLPIMLVITGMLVLLVISYTQVIIAHPDGGGAYAVSKANLGGGRRCWPRPRWSSTTC